MNNCRQILSDQARQALNMPKFMAGLFKAGVHMGVTKMVNYVNLHADLLHSYCPIGTYYLYGCDPMKPPVVTQDPNIIEALFAFHPPLKFVFEGRETPEVRVNMKLTDQRCAECLIKKTWSAMGGTRGKLGSSSGSVSMTATATTTA